MDQIIIGDVSSPLYEFEAQIVGGVDSPIKEITSNLSVDVVGSTLSIDQLFPKVRYDKDAAELFSPADYDGILTSDGYLFATNRVFSDLRTLPYGTEVRYLRDGELFGKFYVKNVDRIAKEIYRINAMSAVGLLDRQQHNGGVYSGETFEEVARDIIGESIPFSCDDNVAGQKIYGWLPMATKRENLHQLLFAVGVTLSKDSNGDIQFIFLAASNSAQINDARIYYGGSVDYSSPASAVEITEHTFFAYASDETITLFDNVESGDSADNLLVSFQEAPIHDLAATSGLQIVDSGVNYAIVTGVGVLTGKKYTHTTRVIRREAEDIETENVVTVTDATLISFVNSFNVARRVLSYYKNAQTINASFVVNGEKPGQHLILNNPYNENSAGFFQSAEYNITSIIKAKSKIITGYAPDGQGNNFTNFVSTEGYMVTSWLVPPGVNFIQVVLIGGGQGGYSGENGENGGLSQRGSGDQRWHEGPVYSGIGGKGGKRGRGGDGGKVLVVNLEVRPRDVIFIYVGQGGNGGISNGTDSVPGDLGKATTLVYRGVTYSSDNGAARSTGYVNQMDGTVHGLIGRQGRANGLDAPLYSQDGNYAILPGHSIDEYTPQNPRTLNIYENSETGETYSEFVSGVTDIRYQHQIYVGNESNNEQRVTLYSSITAYYSPGGPSGSASSGRQGQSWNQQWPDGLFYMAWGGYGGGAALGGDGGNGYDGDVSENNGHGFAQGGDGGKGGDGMDGLDASQLSSGFGMGGMGGCGGGGGGGGGYALHPSQNYTFFGEGGQGGTGGNGGKGSDGGAFIFY